MCAQRTLGGWVRARLVFECQRMSRNAVLHCRQPLVELLDVRLARVLVGVDRRKGARHAVVPRVEIAHDGALVVELQAVLVAAEPLEHGGHDELASEQRHEAGAGGVPT